MTVTPILQDLPSLIRVRVPAMFWCQNDGGGESVRQAIRWSPSQTVIGGSVRWPAPAILTDRATSNSPSVVGTAGNAVMAWQGKDADRRIWYSRQNHSGKWGTQMLTNFTTTSFPTLARFGNRTLMFWRNTTSPVPQMRWSELRGQTWMIPEFSTTPEASGPIYLPAEDGFAVAEHRGLLYIAYRNRGNDTRISWHTLNRDLKGAEPNYTNWRTTTVPALASDGNNLYVAWRGAEDVNIHWAILAGPDASPHERQVLRDRGTAGGPSLGVLEVRGGLPGAATRRELIMTWVGIPGDIHVWWSAYRNGKWGPQQAFNDRWMNVPLRASLS